MAVSSHERKRERINMDDVKIASILASVYTLLKNENLTASTGEGYIVMWQTPRTMVIGLESEGNK